MFKEDYYKDKRVSSGFGVDRGSYKHSGIDYAGTKKDNIYNQISGKVFKIINAKDYFGTQCILVELMINFITLIVIYIKLVSKKINLLKQEKW